MKKSIVASIASVIVAVLLVGAVMFMNRATGSDTSSQKNGTPVVFSDDRMLLELWSTYKTNMLEPGTLRTLDKTQNNITTSEGQSYTMMRAVWMDDIETFDQTWQWTKDNLQREDNLFSWKFGQLANGEYGIQTSVGGNNTATDGDTDIAFALLMAASRWNDAKYLYDARPILSSVWAKQVVMINGKPVLAANDIERLNPESIIVNPSYLTPYAYKVFAKVDPARDWQALADNSYSILFAASDSQLDAMNSAGLAPNWIRVNRTTGEIRPADDAGAKISRGGPAVSGGLDTNYGYDAFRTPWRAALDWQWNKDARAKQILQKYGVLSDDWANKKSLAAIYSHDGRVVSADQSPAAYGANLSYFIVERPEQAEDIYRSKLLPLYDPDTQSWKTPLSYYDDNWAWFGMALYNGKLTNLTEKSYEE